MYKKLAKLEPQKGDLGKKERPGGSKTLKGDPGKNQGPITKKTIPVDWKPEREIQTNVRDFIQRNQEQKDCDLRTTTTNHKGRDRSKSSDSKAKKNGAIKRILGKIAVGIIIFIAIYSFLAKLSVITSFQGLHLVHLPIQRHIYQ